MDFLLASASKFWCLNMHGLNMGWPGSLRFLKQRWGNIEGVGGKTHTGKLLPKIIMLGFLGITTFMRYLFDAGGYTCFVYTIE